MKYLRYIFSLLALGLYTSAAEISEEVEKLQDDYKGHMKFWGIADDVYEAASGKEYFVLKFQSRQDVRDNDLNYEMHVTIQLTDKKTKTIGYAESIDSPGPVDVDKYLGYSDWEFRIPFNGMKKPKMTAYAIEFGFIKGGQFIPIYTDYDKVESAEEIVAAGGAKLEMKCRQAGRHWVELDH